ncbi:MAG: hypothetical protein HUJ53_05160 [Holdemanella sp.]|nr:hypothetical protein [Holdemanella sp.]
MNKWYIMKDEMGYSSSKMCVIEASEKQEALQKYFEQEDIPEDEQSWFYVIDKAKKDRLESDGYDSEEEMFNDLYPERPIEI